MIIYAMTFIAFIMLIALMAIGVIFHRNSIQGSCGGLNQVDIEKVCSCETTCAEDSRTLHQIQEPKNITSN